jgi:hypothetical protein
MLLDYAAYQTPSRYGSPTASSCSSMPCLAYQNLLPAFPSIKPLNGYQQDMMLDKTCANKILLSRVVQQTTSTEGAVSVFRAGYKWARAAHFSDDHRTRSTTEAFWLILFTPSFMQRPATMALRRNRWCIYMCSMPIMTMERCSRFLHSPEIT